MGAEVAIIAIVGAVAGEVMSHSGNETVATIGEVSRNGSIGVLAGGAVESLTAADAVAATGDAAATVDTGTTLAANVDVADTAGTFSSSEFGASTSQLGSGVSGMTGGDVSTAYAGSIAGDSATNATVMGGTTSAGAYGTAADATLTGSSLNIGDIYNTAKQVNQGVSAVRQVSQALAPRVASNASAIGVRTPAQQFSMSAPAYQNGSAALTGAQQKAFGIADPLTPAQIAPASTLPAYALPVLVVGILAFTYKLMPNG